MKKIAKWMVLLLVICQIAGCFVSCKEKEQEEDETPAFVLTAEALKSYVIVIPTTGSEDMNSVAVSVQGMIEKAVGVKPDIKKDYLVDGSDVFCESEYEILVGYTNRSTSKDFYANVRKKDSGYAMVGKKILILGYTATLANKSAYQFKMDVLDKVAGTGEIMTDGTQKILSGSYSYDSISLNGVDISKYRIVFPQSTVQGENDIASYLQDWIAYHTGYVIPCVNDSSEPTQYEIQVGDTTRITDEMRSKRSADGYGSGKCYLGAEGEDLIWICGSNRSALYTAMTKLLSSAVASDKQITLNTGALVCEPIEDLQLSAMTYNVYYDLNEKQRNPDDVVACIEERSPDVFGLNEAGKDWLNKINSVLASDYACVKGEPAETAADASYNAIYYKKDLYDLVESGTKWLSSTPDVQSKYPDAKHYKIMTYVVLKDKASGAEFMYLNVHLDGSNDSDAHAALKEVRKKQVEIVKSFLEEHTFLPVLVGGDFNEKPGNAVIASMTNNTRFRTGDAIADSKTVLPTCVNGDYTSLAGKTIDYIFVSTDSISVQRYETWDNKVNGKYPSDHIPVYAEVTIKY